jgi:hypothetical protein
VRCESLPAFLSLLPYNTHRKYYIHPPGCLDDKPRYRELRSGPRVGERETRSRDAVNGDTGCCCRDSAIPSGRPISFPFHAHLDH